VQAIVLVGGEGTRLRPLTHRTPKQLAPVLNRPLLEHLMLNLREHGVTVVTLAMTRGTSSDAIRAAFGDGGSLGIDITYAYEETPLGSGGAIANAAAPWDEAFLVCNGDIITDLDVSAMVEAHRARGAELSLSLHEVEDPSPFGVVALEQDGRISRFVEKPPRDSAPSRLVNAGTWLFEPGLVAEMDAARFNRVEDDLFPALAGAGRAIYGFHGRCYWSDVGNPEAYLNVNLDLLQGAITARLPEDWPDDGVAANGASVEQGASVAPPAMIGDCTVVRAGARLDGPVALGANCTIEGGATVARSVLWDGVTVHRDASVRDSILASGVVVEAGAVLERAVVAHDVTIAEGERPPPGARVEPGQRYVAAANA
jgi:mannose-1-phosphate guanylyltransferase